MVWFDFRRAFATLYKYSTVSKNHKKEECVAVYEVYSTKTTHVH